MAEVPLRRVIQHLRRVWPGGAAGLSDAELLDRFVRQKDEAAFELLVWRHAALVMGVCRRVLRHEQDAEDAFQAALLALARKGAAIGRRESVGSWLYKVSYRCALAARAAAARAARDGHQSVREPPDPERDSLWRELRPIIDAEINGLSDRYRVPFVLCCLEGRTMQEAATQLGLPPATVGTQVRRARQQLRARLARRGVTLSVGGLTAALTTNAATAAVPAALLASSIHAASRVGSGQLAAAAAFSARVTGLTEGVLRAMWVKKLLPIVTAVVLIVGGIGLACRGLSHGQTPARAEGPAKPPEAPGRGKAKQEPQLKAVLGSVLESSDAVEDFNPKVWVLCGIARVQARAGQRDAAAATLRRTLEVVDAHKADNEGDVGNKFHRVRDVAACQAETGDVKAALETARAIEQEDTRQSALAAVAAAQARDGDVKGAFKTAELIGDNDLRKGEALRGIATAQAEARDFKAALETAAAIPDDTSKASTLAAVAARQVQARDAGGAARTLAEALALATKVGASHVVADVAGIQAEAGETDKARQTAEGIDDAGSRGQAWGRIALAQAVRGDAKAAVATADLIKDDDQKGEALKEVAAALARAKDVAGAVTVLEAVKSELWHFYALLEVARAQAGAGRQDQAARTFAKASEEARRLGDHPRYGRVRAYALANLAAARAGSGEEKEALEGAEKLEPGLARALSLLRVAEVLVERTAPKRPE